MQVQGNLAYDIQRTKAHNLAFAVYLGLDGCRLDDPVVERYGQILADVRARVVCEVRACSTLKGEDDHWLFTVGVECRGHTVGIEIRAGEDGLILAGLAARGAYTYQGADGNERRAGIEEGKGSAVQQWGKLRCALHPRQLDQYAVRSVLSYHHFCYIERPAEPTEEHRDGVLDSLREVAVRRIRWAACLHDGVHAAEPVEVLLQLCAIELGAWPRRPADPYTEPMQQRGHQGDHDEGGRARRECLQVSALHEGPPFCLRMYALVTMSWLRAFGSCCRSS